MGLLLLEYTGNKIKDFSHQSKQIKVNKMKTFSYSNQEKLQQHNTSLTTTQTLLVSNTKTCKAQAKIPTNSWSQRRKRPKSQEERKQSPLSSDRKTEQQSRAPISWRVFRSQNNSNIRIEWIHIREHRKAIRNRMMALRIWSSKNGTRLNSNHDKSRCRHQSLRSSRRLVSLITKWDSTFRHRIYQSLRVSTTWTPWGWRARNNSNKTLLSHDKKSLKHNQCQVQGQQREVDHLKVDEVVTDLGSKRANLEVLQLLE